MRQVRAPTAGRCEASALGGSARSGRLRARGDCGVNVAWFGDRDAPLTTPVASRARAGRGGARRGGAALGGAALGGAALGGAALGGAADRNIARRRRITRTRAAAAASWD